MTDKYAGPWKFDPQTGDISRLDLLKDSYSPSQNIIRQEMLGDGLLTLRFEPYTDPVYGFPYVLEMNYSNCREPLNGWRNLETAKRAFEEWVKQKATTPLPGPQTVKEEPIPPSTEVRAGRDVLMIGDSFKIESHGSASAYLITTNEHGLETKVVMNRKDMRLVGHWLIALAD